MPLVEFESLYEVSPILMRAYTLAGPMKKELYNINMYVNITIKLPSNYIASCSSDDSLIRKLFHPTSSEPKVLSILTEFRTTKSFPF